MDYISHLYASVGDFGLQADTLILSGEKATRNHLTLSDIKVSFHNAYCDLSHCCPVVNPGSIALEADRIIIACDAFLLTGNEVIEVSAGSEQFQYSYSNVNHTVIRGLDEFQALGENELLYQMHIPACDRKRPLILFLHGGGECGHDNISQLTGTMGAVSLAHRYPDFYVMAPQASDNGVSLNDALKSMKAFSDFDEMDLGAETSYHQKARGWNRKNLSLIAGEIRKLVQDGSVDPSRIYLTGMSMGGGGCLQMLSVAPDLFAASCIICPTMNSDTYTTLYNLPSVPCWFSSAYIDHQKNRHVFLLNGCSHLWEEGRKDVKLTLFLSSELKKYHIGSTPGLTDAQICTENHSCWTLVYHNKHAMLSWMVAQTRNVL